MSSLKILIEIPMEAENKSMDKFRVNLAFETLYLIFIFKFLIECDW